LCVYVYTCVCVCVCVCVCTHVNYVSVYFKIQFVRGVCTYVYFYTIFILIRLCNYVQKLYVQKIREVKKNFNFYIKFLNILLHFSDIHINYNGYIHIKKYFI